MKKINETLIRKLAFEERLGLYRIAQSKDTCEEIEHYEILTLLQKIEKLTEVALNSVDFNEQSMMAVGIDNCCNYFKALCQQYRNLIVNGEDGPLLARQERMDINMREAFGRVKPRTIDIGLYDSAKIVDDAINENFVELMNGSMKGNSVRQVYEYAMFSTFLDMYYSIRDHIEGETYYDGELNEYRELPDEYKNSSKRLMWTFMEAEKIDSLGTAKSRLLDTLSEGIGTLASIPLENRIEELRQTQFGEHGYPDSDTTGTHK